MLASLLGWALLGAPDGELRWDAPPGCPDRTEMVARIDAAGGRGELVVDGVVTEVGGGQWQLALSLALHGEQDTRTLTGADCHALADAAVVLIAVRLDRAPPIVAEPPEPEPEPEPEPGPEPEPEPEPGPEPETEPAAAPEADATPDPDDPTTLRREPEPTPRRSRPDKPAFDLPTGLVLALGGGISLGAMPAPGVPLDLGIGYARPRIRLAARGRYHVPRRIDVDGGQGALLQQGVAQLEACARPAVRRLELPACGIAAVGGSRSDARGPGARDRAGLWAETGVEVGAAIHLTSQWALAARLGAAVVLAGTRYVIGDRQVFSPSPVVGRLVVSIEWTQPVGARARVPR